MIRTRYAAFGLAITLAMSAFAFSALADHGEEAPDELDWACSNTGIREDVVAPVPITECEDENGLIIVVPEEPPGEQDVHNAVCDRFEDAPPAGSCERDGENATYAPGPPEDTPGEQDVHDAICGAFEDEPPVGTCERDDDGNVTYDPSLPDEVPGLQDVDNAICDAFGDEPPIGSCERDEDENATYAPGVPSDVPAAQDVHNAVCDQFEDEPPTGSCERDEHGNATYEPDTPGDVPSVEQLCGDTDGAIPGCVRNDNGTYSYDPSTVPDGLPGPDDLIPDDPVPDEPIPEDVPLGLGCQSQDPDQFVGSILFDTDCDGVPTGTEIEEGCDPTDAESHPDGDEPCAYDLGRLLEDLPVPIGCTDAFPSALTDPAQWDQFLGRLVFDTDCDGRPTGSELEAGCDPLDPESYPGGPTPCESPAPAVPGAPEVPDVPDVPDVPEAP